MNSKQRALAGFALAAATCALATCALWLALAVSIVSAQTSRSDSANSSIEHGSSWLKKGEFDRAISDFNLAIATDRQMAGAWYGRGVAR